MLQSEMLGWFFLFCFRERKKQKYTSLKAAVDELSAQLDRVAILEQQALDMSDEKEQLQSEIKQQNLTIAAHSTKLKLQESYINQQAARLTQQQQELQALRQQHPTADAELESTPLYQKLVAVVKAAVVDSASPQPASTKLQDVVTHAVHSTLKSCALELALSSKERPADVRPKSPSVAQVSCY
jgi:SMC interacting uncharacterized protein involved in chromosome segregation